MIKAAQAGEGSEEGGKDPAGGQPEGQRAIGRGRRGPS